MPVGNPVRAPTRPRSPRTTVAGGGAALPTAAPASTPNVETRPSGTLSIGGKADTGFPPLPTANVEVNATSAPIAVRRTHGARVGEGDKVACGRVWMIR